MSHTINQEKFNELKSIMGEMFTTLIDTFIDDTEKNLNELRNGLSNNNVDEVHRLAHSLKSTSANIGAEQLSAVAKKFELEAKEGNLTHAKERINELEELYAVVKQEIK